MSTITVIDNKGIHYKLTDEGKLLQADSKGIKERCDCNIPIVEREEAEYGTHGKAGEGCQSFTYIRMTKALKAAIHLPTFKCCSKRACDICLYCDDHCLGHSTLLEGTTKARYSVKL